MKRNLTNKIRFILDEFIPPIIRDSKWFMWPLYVIAYRKLSVHNLMNYKASAYSMSKEEYAQFYLSLGNSISRHRMTDLNQASINYLVGCLPKIPGLSVLDVGSGNGYLLEILNSLNRWIRVAGIDVVPMDKKIIGISEVYEGALPDLPFDDKEFDVVTCTHVIEHVVDVAASVKELIRVTKKMIISVVPRQRYYNYTLDEHLNFYYNIEPIVFYFSKYSIVYSLQDGDWVLIVDLEKT